MKLQAVLTPDEAIAVDEFCGRHAGIESLPLLAKFLRERFNLTLDLDPDIIAGFVTDSSNLPGQAKALARPASIRECAVLFRACYAAKIPITVSAGKSNLTGSATPEQGVIISTINMSKPEPKVDLAGKTVSAPVGMILEDLRNEVLKASGGKLIYPVDPTSRADSTVGGTIACNASGFVPGETGATRAWVEEIEILLPNGLALQARRGQYVSGNGIFLIDDGKHVVELPVPRYRRPAIKNAGGPFSAPDGVMDFIDLIVGSEGLFGLVTACKLKLIDRPDDYLDLFFSLPEEKNAVKFLDFLRRRLGGKLGALSALEYFGVNCRGHMDHEDILFKGRDQAGIYLQVPLRNKTMEDAAEEWLGILMEADCDIDEQAIMLLDNDRNRKLFMESRHSLPARALEVVKQRGTFTIMSDTVVPPEKFAEFLAFTHNLIKAEGLDYVAFGHFGDCHLHFTILPHKEQLERAVAVYDKMVAKSAELGGVYSGEHGTGKRKRKDFLQCYGPEGAAQVLACKHAVDPDLLFNRGNVVAFP